jgi:two-component system OmpR family response regulator
VRVLVVEAEPKMAGLLKRGLDEEGHPADVAPTGEETLQMARPEAYDAIGVPPLSWTP